MKTITVKIKQVYGNTVAYPVCEQSRLLAQLAGTTTLTIQALKIIKSLGFEVIQQTPELLGI
jgi:hypothetical protein